jgi:hypothetical protein
MGDVLKMRPRMTEDRYRTRTLCQEGFHKWAEHQPLEASRADGGRATVYRCEWCGLRKIE